MCLRAPWLVFVLLAVALAGCGSEAKLASRSENDLGILKGLPQQGTRLGKADAPATLTVYTAMTDFNGPLLRGDLPAIIRKYVRTRRLKIQVRTVTKVAADRLERQAVTRLTRIAQAAALQSKFWDFFLAFDTVYTGSYAQEQLDAAIEAVPSLDAAQVRSDAGSSRVKAAIIRANQRAGGRSLLTRPVYVLERPGASAKELATGASGSLLPALRAALANRARPGRRTKDTPTPKRARERRAKPKAKKQTPPRPQPAAPTPRPDVATPAPDSSPPPPPPASPSPPPRPSATVRPPSPTPQPEPTPPPKIPVKPD